MMKIAASLMLATLIPVFWPTPAPIVPKPAPGPTSINWTCSGDCTAQCVNDGPGGNPKKGFEDTCHYNGHDVKTDNGGDNKDAEDEAIHDCLVDMKNKHGDCNWEPKLGACSFECKKL